MADIVFRYPEMRQAVTDIQGIAARYKTAATTLESDLPLLFLSGKAKVRTLCRNLFLVL